MTRWLAFPAGRRSKWTVLAVALAVLFVAGSFAGKFEGVLNNEPVSYLPGSAESVKHHPARAARMRVRLRRRLE